MFKHLLIVYKVIVFINYIFLKKKYITFVIIINIILITNFITNLLTNFLTNCLTNFLTNF